MVRVRHPEIGIKRPVLAKCLNGIVHYIQGLGLNREYSVHSHEKDCQDGLKER